MGTSCKKPGRQEQEEKAMTKEDVLLPQDAQAVDPSKLSALTPEVVSFSVRRIEGRRGERHAKR